MVSYEGHARWRVVPLEPLPCKSLRLGNDLVILFFSTFSVCLSNSSSNKIKHSYGYGVGL